MYSTVVAAALSGLALVSAQSAPVPGVTGKLGDAAIVNNNPAGATYIATLPNSKTSGIRGYVSGTSASNGTGVVFTVNLFGFPTGALGPFLYHIHDQPVPANGNCTATLAHLDPYVRGEVPPCDATQPQTCQVGDLAGKHGNITSPGLQTSYTDLYVSSAAGLGSFFGNRSIVVHSPNTTRLTCASFVLSNSSTTNSTNITTVTPPTPSVSPFTGGAATNFAGATAVIGAAVALMAYFL